jgi:hypothetical protein
MTKAIKLTQVNNPKSITILPVVDAPTNAKVLMQIYTGVVAFDFNQSSQDTIIHDSITCFVPYEDYTLQKYDSLEAQITAIGSLTSIYQDNTPSLAAVDETKVELQSIDFLGDSGIVLVLTAKVAAMRGSAGALAYQVTIVCEPVPLDQRVDEGKNIAPPTT